jgi:PTH2 family peptidyl-tRNA hydrolase
MISQGSHASLGSFLNADTEIRELWLKEGAKKVVLKVNSLKEIKSLHKKAKAAKLPFYLVKDAGLTQVKAGSITALGIGPAEEKEIDKITGKLKLL